MYFRQGGFVAQTDTVSLDDIPRVYEALKTTGQDGSFAVFMPPKLEPDEDALNIQFSIENGSIGLDWVLISPVNIRDKGKFVELLNTKRIPYRELEMNNVSYLRIEDGRSAKMCQSMLEEMYGVSGRIGIELIVEGFDWPAGDD
ncbi:MAG: hypothetical protein QNJ19_03450 [Woeseiaceae bacterium]|nr:hypothetical protein [Woeseiaceae bacterium]